MYKVFLLAVFLQIVALAARADDEGYIYYAKGAVRIGSLRLKKDDAILVRPKLKRIKPAKSANLTAEIEFKKMAGGKPQGRWKTAWMRFDRFTLITPVRQTDPTQWTTEPPHKHPGQGAVASDLCPAKEAECLAVTKLVSEFHNSSYCDRINRTALAMGSRRDQLLESWSEFIREKTQGRCRPGPPGRSILCNRLNRARDSDLLARTAVFEAEGNGKIAPSPALDARHACEEDFIMLAIRNLALDNGCSSRRRRSSRKSGCKYRGDFTHVAAKPTEFNIWFPEDTLMTRITGCFLRADLDKRTWMSNPFFVRKDDYLKTLPRAFAITDPKAKMEKFFHIETEENKLPDDEERRLINGTKYYYHPAGMDKCDPDDYDKSVFIGTGYVSTKKGDYLLSGLRFVPDGPKGATKIGHVYEVEFRGKRYGTVEQWKKIFSSFEGGKVPEKFIDRDRANVCWPSKDSGCTVDAELGYRKAPKWAVHKANTGYRLSCRTRDQSGGATWTFRGSCDSGMVIAPQINQKAMFN